MRRPRRRGGAKGKKGKEGNIKKDQNGDTTVITPVGSQRLVMTLPTNPDGTVDINRLLSNSSFSIHPLSTTDVFSPYDSKCFEKKKRI